MRYQHKIVYGFELAEFEVCLNQLDAEGWDITYVQFGDASGRAHKAWARRPITESPYR